MDGRQLVEGFPNPPHWHKLFEGLPDNLSTVEEFEAHGLKPPPIPPGASISVFGVPLSVTELPQIVPLDSDNKAYKDVDENGNPKDLRDEFKRIFEDMVDEIGLLIGQGSQCGHPTVTNVSTTSKKIIKLYKNLHFILVLMRDFQFYQTLRASLQAQLDQRLQIMNDIRQVAFALEPLSLDQAIDSSWSQT